MNKKESQENVNGNRLAQLIPLIRSTQNFETLIKGFFSQDSENSDQFLLAVRVEDCHHQDLNESTTAADSNNDFHEEAFVIISNDAEAGEEGDAEQFVHHPVTISEEGTDERTTTADHDSCLKYER